MTDRDTFAAAAMTGIITTECGYELEHFAKMCYEHADAMLRERERTNHDAVPEARAANDGGTPEDADGTGNTQEPLGWVLRHSMYGPHHDSFYPTKATAEAAARMNPAWTLIPLYRQPLLTLTAEEREAVSYFAVIEGDNYLTAANTAAATLRKMLERLGGER